MHHLVPVQPVSMNRINGGPVINPTGKEAEAY